MSIWFISWMSIGCFGYGPSRDCPGGVFVVKPYGQFAIAVDETQIIKKLDS